MTPTALKQAREALGLSCLARFDAKYIPEPMSGCWLWTGAADRYGMFMVSKGRPHQKAHRVAWELRNASPIPPGLEVCHSCDVPLCVNPDHLFLGTHAQNMADAARKNRINPPGLKGEANRRAKLTNAEVWAIRAARGLQKEIATRHNVSRALVGLIRQRKLWGHI